MLYVSSRVSYVTRRSVARSLTGGLRRRPSPASIEEPRRRAVGWNRSRSQPQDGRLPSVVSPRRRRRARDALQTTSIGWRARRARCRRTVLPPRRSARGHTHRPARRWLRPAGRDRTAANEAQQTRSIDWLSGTIVRDRHGRTDGLIILCFDFGVASSVTRDMQQHYSHCGRSLCLLTRCK